MFSYQSHYPCLKSHCYQDASGKIRFDPPVYQQRYGTVANIIDNPCWNTQFKKIVDFGCGEMNLLQLLRNVPNVEHILEIDVDEEVLQKNKYRADPLTSDYIKKRGNPLRIEILKGSIDKSFKGLRDVDVVIAVEVIEHLYPDVLENLPKNIFGFIQPKLVIITTPNSEFNVLFEPLLENGFRHLDHKFEWTRNEFKRWCLNVCSDYPNYNVTMLGVGEPPEVRALIGNVTQIAVFARNDILGKPLTHEINQTCPADPDAQYKIIYTVDFPYYRDNRTKEQKILDNALYHIRMNRFKDKYFDTEEFVYKMPIGYLIDDTVAVGGTEEELRSILNNNNYKVERDHIILPRFDEEEESSDEDDCFFEGNDQEMKEDTRAEEIWD